MLNSVKVLEETVRHKIIGFYNEGMSADEIQFVTGLDIDLINDLVVNHIEENPCGQPHKNEEENCMQCKIIKSNL